MALRGAITVDRDDGAAIVSGTAELLGAMLARNGIGAQDLVSVLFTATGDLTSEFPAAAARAMGIASVPLLCAREIDVPGAVPRCIRVLMHVYLPRGTSAHHVYLRAARTLRDDLPE